jgi:hypothetical protein
MAKSARQIRGPGRICPLIFFAEFSAPFFSNPNRTPVFPPEMLVPTHPSMTTLLRSTTPSNFVLLFLFFLFLLLAALPATAQDN